MQPPTFMTSQQRTDRVSGGFSSAEPSNPGSVPAPPVDRAFGSMDATAEAENALLKEPRRVLVVDRSPAVCRDLSFLLQGRGYEVFDTGCPKKAIEIADARQPDLVLLGSTVDGEDVLETCRRLKATEALAEAPVIFLIDCTESWNAAEGFLAGASDYIAKPIRVREALSRIEKHVGMRHLLQSRRRQIAELGSINRAKDRILRIASHDLRNSLSAIGDLAGMLGAEVFGTLNTEQKEMLASITAAAEGVVDLVGDLHAISSIDAAGSARFTRQRITDVAQTTFRLAKGTAAKKQISLSLNMKTEPPASFFDRNQIRRVIENFLSNALKFSQSGGSVDMRIEHTAESIRVEVHDQGPGVPLDQQALLFKEFSLTTVKPTGGERCTGLGLFISRQIVSLHRGEIGMFNRPEGGACFYFTLPIGPNPSEGTSHAAR